MLAAATVLALSACGPEGTTAATDPEPSESTPSPTASPTASPTVGTYPAYEPEDYSFTLVVGCFCADGGAPIEVTVVDGKVVGAIYQDGGRGVKAGDPADQYRWLTINDVIDAANDTKADKVTVDWPAGQDYPSSVSVDTDLRMADEEISYHISNVTTA